MSKPKVAIFDFACCEGCQLQIVNMEEEILDLLSVADVVEWREAMSETSEVYDVAIIEGSITRLKDEERVKKIRAQAKVLVALGACATIGGVNKIKNSMKEADVKTAVYGKHANDPHLETYAAKALDEVVKVDVMIHGCPIDRKEFATILRCLLTGRTPFIPTYPVCVECKMKGNVCLYQKGEICLGILTRAGCGARCPSSGFWCCGCRGFLPGANFEAAEESMKLYGKTAADLRSRMKIFQSLKEAPHA
jgi:coenzyme F420-reducing hydrogenase gamma subunit